MSFQMNVLSCVLPETWITLEVLHGTIFYHLFFVHRFKTSPKLLQLFLKMLQH